MKETGERIASERKWIPLLVLMMFLVFGVTIWCVGSMLPTRADAQDRKSTRLNSSH